MIWQNLFLLAVLLPGVAGQATAGTKTARSPFCPQKCARKVVEKRPRDEHRRF